MDLYYISIAIPIFSNIAYHLCMKSLPTTVDPIFALLITYVVSVLTCLVILFLFNPGALNSQWKSINWIPLVLGVSLVALEFGFILAYRSGWSLNNAAVVCNVAVGMLLIPIGLIFFRESMSMARCFGIAFSLAGLYLLSLR